MKSKLFKSIYRISGLFILVASLLTQQVVALTQDDINCAQSGSLVCFYEPGECSTSPPASAVSTPGITINNTAAQQAAQQASNGGTTVGYALYNSSGQRLASYNSTFENYGASITKSMILVAYLNQVGAGTINPVVTSEISGMIEQSNDSDANDIFNLLTNPKAEIENVAQEAGMTGFQYNDQGDSVYYLGQSQITADDFAKFFSKIDTMFPSAQKSFALNLLSNIQQQVGLLQAGLPGPVYSKEGWKPEPGTVDDSARSGSPNPFGVEGAPYIVNQAAQFSSGGTTYGIAVTVAGAQGATQAAQQSTGEAIIKNVVSTLINPGAPTIAPQSLTGSCSCDGSSSTVTAGTGAPDGASFPNLDPSSMATAINTWVSQQNPNSELKGLGSTIVADGKNSNVNPFLIVSIAKEESSLADPSDYNVANGNNSFGRTASPSQPHFQGATLWYKWSSVEASVDYTAPENQNVAGGGDIASYIRDQYSSQLDSNNIVALMEAYAPPSQNNTAQYIANIKSWIGALINLTDTGGESSTTSSLDSLGGCTSSVSCPSGGTVTGDEAILCEAEKYAGIYYLYGGGHNGYAAFRAQCPESALSSAASTSSPGDPGPCATDCSGLVSMALDAAFNQNYDWTVSNSNGQMVGSGANYWQSIPISEAQPGDIVTSNSGDGSQPPGTDGHVEIVVSVNGSTINTFGSHYTGTQTGPVSGSASGWDTGAWRWTGPGSGS